jgi:hypothetical protein
VAASSNGTACFWKLRIAFCGSHENTYCIYSKSSLLSTRQDPDPVSEGDKWPEAQRRVASGPGGTPGAGDRSEKPSRTRVSSAAFAGAIDSWGEVRLAVRSDADQVGVSIPR